MAAAALIRMKGLDFSMGSDRLVAESLARGNIMVFTVQYDLQYIVGPQYRYRNPVGTPK